MKLASASVNVAWVGAQTRAYLAFLRALRRPQHVQTERLLHYLRANARSEFGRRYGFDRIRSVGQFQNQVPLSDYEDYEEAVARIHAGRPAVLTAAPVRCLQPSSGSTSVAKLIPYTQELQTEFSAAIGPWVFDLARTTPGILGGPAYWSITPQGSADYARSAARESANLGATTDMRIGFESDSAYLGGWLKRLADLTLIACDDLQHAGDIGDFRRRTLLRLLNERELRLISIWHPTFLTLLLDEMATSWEALLDDLARGLPAAGRLRGIPANPARARELTGADPTVPRSIWPRLALLSCWGDAHAAMLFPELRARLAGVAIQPKGLLATEAVVSLPFARWRPLAIRSHFFEFIDSRGSPKTAWQLEAAAIYSVVVTTGGGLYRYRLRDKVQVEGFLHATPCIRFVGKEDSISDLCGEKLSEGMTASILARLLPAHAPCARFALLAPEIGGRPPRYILFLESQGIPSARLSSELEAALAENPHYAHCVRLGQLQPATVEHVSRGASERYIERLRASGQRLGNIKPAALSALPGWRSVFATEAHGSRAASASR